MQYITSAERIGVEKGMQQGIQKGELDVLARQLSHRFGTLPKRYENQLHRLNAESLLALSEKVLFAKTLAEVFSEDSNSRRTKK